MTESNYQYLSELTGKNVKTLASMKSKKRKIKSLNCYMVDEKVTLEQRRAWYENEKFEQEAWKTVHGSNGEFLISNYGRFKRVRKNKDVFLMPFLRRRNGKLEIRVRFNGCYKQYSIAKLVAYHFVGTPKPGEVLHHKNLIITDNFSGNLEYISKSKLGKKTGALSTSKPVVQLDRDTLEVIDEFRSAREAGRKCYLSYQAVLDNCNHKSKTSGGYIFMFLEEYEEIEVLENASIG